MTVPTVALCLCAGLAQAQTACGASYTIQPGDTLYGVSQKCDVGLTAIMDRNPGLDPRDLGIGQEIRLAASGGGIVENDTAGTRTYRVEAGDTMYSIARALGVTALELLNANTDLDPLDLAIGEAIRIPGDDRTAGFSITPRSGPVGSEVTLRARHLRPNDWVSIGAGPNSAEWRVIDQVQVADDGEITTRVEVPGWADPRQDLVYVIDTDRGLTLKSGRFDVTRRHAGGDDGDAGERITLQGRVREGTECMVLETADGDVWSLVSDDIRFTPGEHVRVTGQRTAAAFCQQGLGTVEVATITETGSGGDGGEDDRLTLEGRVSEGVECMVLKTDDGDVWSLVSDAVRFTPGEYVRVKGNRADMSYCQQGLGTVEVDTIREVEPG